MENLVIKKTVFVDFLGKEFDTENEAIQSNHDIHLVFRSYILNELIETFSDGKIDKLKTSKNLWDFLDFTPECIKTIYEYEIEMDRK